MTTDWTQTWRQAEVQENLALARSTRLTRLRLPDDLPFPFEPGHVVALRAETDKGLIRHPYTLSFADPDSRTVGIVYRVIPDGRLTPHLASAKAGSLAELQGLHHQPIRLEMDPEAPAFLGVGTGSGAGPLAGFAAQALGSGFSRPLLLVLGFREAQDIVFASELDRLAAAHPNFRWAATLSAPAQAWPGLRGHVQAHLPALLGEHPGAHVHLVGNMAMIRTVRAALEQAAWPERRVTHEGFFNWNAEADQTAAAALALALRSEG
ncbi:MAG TPA: FAD-dependent oxidoreductase [Holophagaceae bacterium]|nr:FAD-dependent oxidoreductase [Holophagaceae bacterium]